MQTQSKQGELLITRCGGLEGTQQTDKSAVTATRTTISICLEIEKTTLVSSIAGEAARRVASRAGDTVITGIFKF